MSIPDKNNQIDPMTRIGVRKGLTALSPIVVFLTLYLVVSLCSGDFYAMPVSVAFVAASMWAILTDSGKPLAERVETMSKAAGNPGIIYMIWIFILAGAFATLAKEIGAVDAMVAVVLEFLPYQLILPGMFLAACLISLSIGTSVGTVVALTPLAVDLANTGGGNGAMFVAAVLGGAFFGDNLSFISDTTVAATRTQDVAMNAKFRANLRIAVPAAAVALIVYAFLGWEEAGAGLAGNTLPTADGSNALLLLPYLLVIGTAIAGINVLTVLVIGIVSAIVIACLTGEYTLLDLARYMGDGAVSMGELIIVTVLAAGMRGVIRSTGGIDFLLQQLTARIHGAKGAKLSIAVLVSSVNVCTANNTVAILTVGSLTKRIAGRYGLSGARTASLLDTCSCVTQCLLPYGAQTLLAAGLAGMSPGDPWPYLYYPWALAATVAVSIAFTSRK